MEYATHRKYSDLFSFNNSWNFRTVSMFLLLLALPNLLGLINISTPFGFKIHFFQIAVFLAAAIYGPKGGFLSGAIGSVFAAVMMANPYIIIGNAILGLCAGIFMRLGIHTLGAVLLAFIIQLPWLVLTDYFLVGLPAIFIINLMIALTVSNAVWAIIVHLSRDSVGRIL